MSERKIPQINPFQSRFQMPDKLYAVVANMLESYSQNAVFPNKEDAEKYADALNRKAQLYSDYLDLRYVVTEVQVWHTIEHAKPFPDKVLVEFDVYRYPEMTGGWFINKFTILRNEDKFDKLLFDVYKPGVYIDQICNRITMVFEIPIVESDDFNTAKRKAITKFNKAIIALKEVGITPAICEDMRTVVLKPLGFVPANQNCLIGQQVYYFKESFDENSVEIKKPILS